MAKEITGVDIDIELPAYISERDVIAGTWTGPPPSRYVSPDSLVQVRSLVKQRVAEAIQQRGYTCTPDEVRVSRHGTWRVAAAD